MDGITHDLVLGVATGGIIGMALGLSKRLASALAVLAALVLLVALFRDGVVGLDVLWQSAEGELRSRPDFATGLVVALVAGLVMTSVRAGSGANNCKPGERDNRQEAGR